MTTSLKKQIPNNNSKMKRFNLLLSLGILLTGTLQAGEPLKVYLLVGQSNMVGHANTTTIPWMAKDPNTKALHDKMVDPSGKAKVYDDVRISYISEAKDGRVTLAEGALSVGYGAWDQKIGPELAFGITMHENLKEPILLIKTAWGGKSLHTDFRPPSAGHYVYSPSRLAFLAKRDKITEDEVTAQKRELTGVFYKKMIAHIKKVLSDPGEVHPAYDKNAGYEIAGLVWFQGWNDMCDSNTYPNKKGPGRFEDYSTLFGHFIRDVRKDLDVPNLPISIGVLGAGGCKSNNPKLQSSTAAFQDAMAAPAALPEFKDSVYAVQTGKYWDFIQDAAQVKKWQIRKEADKLAKQGKFKVEAKDDPSQAKHKAMVAERAAKAAYEAKRLDEIRTPEEKEAVKGISHKSYHYLGSAKILSRIGEALAKALIEKKGN